MGAGVGDGRRDPFLLLLCLCLSFGFLSYPSPPPPPPFFLFQLKILLPAKDALYPSLEVSLSLWGNSLKLVISYVCLVWFAVFYVR